MKSMVLAAGIGRRLRPLTVCWAKPALPVLGRPLIQYTLVLLGRAGIRDVVVNLHHKPESIKRALSGAATQGFHLHYSEEEEILGTAGGLKKVESLLGEDTFVLVNGDCLVDVEITEIIESHRRFGGEATLLLRPKPTGSDYTAIGLDRDSRLVSMGGEPPSPLMFAGIWVLEPSVLERISPDRSCGLEELLPVLMKEDKAFGFVKDVAWFDIGTPRRYLNACLGAARHGVLKEYWRVEAAPASLASPTDTVVVVGSGTVIDSGACFTGDSVLGANCRVGPNARIQRSVLWDGVLVGEGATVRNSIVAADVRLPAGSHTENKIVLDVERACKDVRAREVVEGHVVASIKR